VSQTPDSDDFLDLDRVADFIARGISELELTWREPFEGRASRLIPSQREWDECLLCDHLRALHGVYGCSACECKRSVL